MGASCLRFTVWYGMTTSILVILARNSVLLVQISFEQMKSQFRAMKWLMLVQINPTRRLLPYYLMFILPVLIVMMSVLIAFGGILLTLSWFVSSYACYAYALGTRGLHNGFGFSSKSRQKLFDFRRDFLIGQWICAAATDFFCFSIFFSFAVAHVPPQSPACQSECDSK